MSTRRQLTEWERFMRELNRERFQRLTPAQARQRVEQREKQLRLDDDDDQPQQHQPREQA